MTAPSFRVAAGAVDRIRRAPVLIVVCVDLERGMRATVGSSTVLCVQ